MIIYGDPLWHSETSALLARFRSKLADVRHFFQQHREQCQHPAGVVLALDRLRDLLISAGQIEQSMQDVPADRVPPPVLSTFMSITDRAAQAFYQRWAADQGLLPAFHETTADVLTGIDPLLEKVTGLPEMRLEIKVPEGFAFYQLYPEQYIAAARRWSEDQAAARRRVVVVGIRSIGTTLSAVVAAALHAEGWNVSRVTLRPFGPADARQAAIRREDVAGADWALVVDEGPGRSGSSMVSAAEALTRVGVDRTRIGFLPGHPGEPGTDASAEVRAWWAAVPRWVVPVNELRWNGRTLPQILAEQAAVLCAPAGPFTQIEDLGGGLWRRHLPRSPRRWPPACPAFETPKYRCTGTKGIAVLWKFAGLADDGSVAGSQGESLLARLRAQGAEGWTPMPLGHACGFVALPWVAGTPLTLADRRDPALLTHIGRYIAAVAGPPLSSDEQQEAMARLREMFYWNTWEALGESAAARAQAWNEVAAAWEAQDDAARYGDGHLAPWEWLRTEAGEILKMDSGGHDADHTIIGCQPLAWDLAGAMVEWRLNTATVGPLLSGFAEAGGRVPSAEALAFFCMAYAAFRLGMLSLSADFSTHDPDEQRNLQRARFHYQADLRQRLESPQPQHPFRQ